MPDWAPPPTIELGDGTWEYVRTDANGLRIFYRPESDSFMNLTTIQLKLLDGTWERELRAFAKRMFDDLLGRTIATDCLCDAYSEELETILNNYKEKA